VDAMAMNLKTCFIASMYIRLLKFKEPTQGKRSYYNLKLEIPFLTFNTLSRILIFLQKSKAKNAIY